MRKTGILCVLVLATTAFGGEKMEPATITVTGSAKLATVPDLVDIQVGVQTQEETAAKALKGNSKDMQALFATIKQAGIPSKDVQTATVSIRPAYKTEKKTEETKIVGYVATNMVVVTVRNPDLVGTMLDEATKAGANRVYGISFRVEKPEPLYDDLRKKAAADARRKAEMIANQLGVKLGQPLRITDGSDRAGGQMRGMSFAMGAVEERTSAPISAGERELSGVVDVVFEILRSDDTRQTEAHNTGARTQPE